MKCLIPECSKDSNTRGLCTNCAGTAYFMIKRNETTWEELEKLGLAKPKMAGRGKKGPLFGELAKRRLENDKESTNDNP